MQTAENPKIGQASEGPGDGVAQQTPSVPLGDASTDPVAHTPKPRRGVQIGTEVRLVLVAEIRTLQANADLDPVQRARTIAQLQRFLLRARELQSRWVAEAPPGPHFDLAGEEIGKLRANPDLDPVQRARTIVQLAGVQLRALEQQSRRVAEAHRGPDFDLGAMLEEIWKEFRPELERRRRAALDAERAEMSTDEPNGRASNPS